MALAVVALPGFALAANECGPASTATNPQVASCTGAFNPYAGGISYDESSVPPVNRGNLQVKVTPTVTEVTGVTGVTAKGVSNFGADVLIQSGASIKAGAEGARAFTPGNGTASIENSGAVTAATNGLDAISTGGTASITNASGASVTVSGASASAGATATGASSSVANAG